MRITVPADIYNSGIICEASGINVHLRLLAGEPSQGQPGRTKFKTSSAQGQSESGEDQVLPTPSNLAESFLESEPKEEKEELQAAISSQSHVLQRSSSFTDEDDEEMGLGDETLSLPSFVAGFLKGVADRLQLNIKDVVVRMDMELKQDAPLKRQPEDKPDVVAGLLSMQEIDVHGVSEFSSGPEESPPLRQGKRLISLENISLGLVSDSVVFSNYSQFTAPASPTTTMHSKESQSSRAPSPPGFNPSLSMTQSTILDPSISYETARNAHPTMEASSHSDGAQFSDADSDGKDRIDGSLDGSQVFDNDECFDDNPGYLESVIDTQFDDFDDERSAPPRRSRLEMTESDDNMHHNISALRDSGNLVGIENQHGVLVPMGNSQRSQDFDVHYQSREDGRQSSGPGDDLQDSLTSWKSTSQPVHECFASASESDSTNSEAGTPTAELAESKYFSHDEAQSLYMSAISQGTGGSFIPTMPGGWDSNTGGSKSKNVANDSVANTVPTTDNCLRQKSSDEAAVSTPKMTAQSESDPGEAQYPEEGTTDFRPANASATSPDLRRPSEVKKNILVIDKIFVWVPSALDEESESSSSSVMGKPDSDLKESNTSMQEPMTEGSMFASRTYASTRLPREPSKYHPPSGLEPTNPPPFGRKRPQRLEVELFSCILRVDIATGWLLAKVCQRISQIIDEPEKSPPSKQRPPHNSASQIDLQLNVHDVALKFVEYVTGHSHPLETDSTVFQPSYSQVDVIILQLTLSGLTVSLSANDRRTDLNLAISKFKLGYGFEDIISFNESMKMRESTRDIMTPSQGDISLSLVKSAESAKIDVSTLPLHLKLNIQHLEEVLSWMGGLSTILELGSSISSASTVRGAPKPSKKRPRGVHFEVAAPKPDKRQAESVPWKVNSRIGGIVLDVTGDSHRLKLSTSAVKVVSRFEGIGVQIDKVKLSGPIPLDCVSDAPAKITLLNTRVEFLFSPKEVDLDRLLTLITPSQDKYDDDDDIMVDTLLRQRSQGSVLRLTVAGMKTVVSDIGGLKPLSSIGQELGRLSNVTKYLPEDDRPGILTLTLVRNVDVQVQVGGEVGSMDARLENVEAAWISMPSLIAMQIGAMSLNREYKGLNEHLVGEALRPSAEKVGIQPQSPIFMARFIPDEMDPTLRIKLCRLRFEYTIPSVVAFLGLGQGATGGDLAGEMASSIASLAEHSGRATDPSMFATRSEALGQASKPTKLAVVFRDCVLGLNPRNSPSKGLVILSNAKFGGSLHDEESSEATFDVRKASIMIIDNVANEDLMDNLHQRASTISRRDQTQAYIDSGYVPVSTISSATAVVKLMTLADSGMKSLDVELRDDLLILETCADSTQTLISILNGLQAPAPPSVAVKYRTEVVPIQDMLSSFSGDAFVADPMLPPNLGVESDHGLEAVPEEDELHNELEYVSDFNPDNQGLAGVDSQHSPEDEDLLDSFHSQYHVSSSITQLDFQDDHFAKQSAVGGTAHRWDSAHNTYGLSNDPKLQRSPLRVRVRDMHIIWNLFDGYDWQRTRDTISKAVKDVENKANERRARTSRMSPTAEDEEESVIGDFLFNSIYIGIPANKDPSELHREINREIDDLTSETGSYATSTTVTGATTRQGRPSSAREKEKKLRLHRSKHHKMTFELRGVCADLVVFPPDSEETQSSLDVRVKDLEIYDHVPTSTWKKFATYMHEAGERESGTSMVHLEILTVKPVPELAASEIVLKVSLSVSS